MGRRTRLALVVCLALCAVASAPAASKKAAKLLKQLKTVDGAGSGLDADTVRGMAPADFGGGGVVVKDAGGNVVGLALPGPLPKDNDLDVVRAVGGVPVVFGITSAGLRTGGLDLFYESPDCTGTPRIAEEPDFGPAILLPRAQVGGTVGAYATGAIATVALRATEFIELDVGDCDARGGVLTARGTCCDAFDTPDTDTATAAATVVDVGSFGLVPPFHVEVR